MRQAQLLDLIKAIENGIDLPLALRTEDFCHISSGNAHSQLIGISACLLEVRHAACRAQHETPAISLIYTAFL